jgi:uncharacterized protein YhhL (DUF1145 family)
MRWKLASIGSLIFAIVWISAAAFITTQFLLEASTLLLYILIPVTALFYGAGLVLLFGTITRKYTFYDEYLRFSCPGQTGSRGGLLGSYKVLKYATDLTMEKKTVLGKNNQEKVLVYVKDLEDNLLLTLKYDNLAVQQVLEWYKDCQRGDDDQFEDYSQIY